MALRSKRIDYTVYPPNHDESKGCWDFRAATKARLAAKRFGSGSRVRRNINLKGKDREELDWWVERVWEWNGERFIDITKHSTKLRP
jgi:hypothetical protein